MPSRRSAIPPLNRQLQANNLVTAPVDYQQTGQRTFEQSTPLRWLLQTLEDIIFVETLSIPNDTETISDPEASCPVCFETYRKPHEGRLIVPESDEVASRRLLHERPLELECGHVIGKACLRRIIDMRTGYADVPKCPMCRGPIYTTISVVPLARSSDRQADIVGLLCCVIRLFILFNLRQPETHKALFEWVHGPTFGGRTIEEGQLFAEMRNAVEIWDEFGDSTMWGWMLARKRGGLPNEELESNRSGGVNRRYTALLSSTAPVLQRVTIMPTES